MKKLPWKKIVVVMVLALAIIGVSLLKGPGSSHDSDQAEQPVPEARQSLPRFIEFGSVECIPCRLMLDVVEELRTQYAGRLRVEVIDIDEHPEVAKRYNVKGRPVQLFFDADGKEIHRHFGFIPAEDVVAKFRELGVELIP